MNRSTPPRILCERGENSLCASQPIRYSNVVTKDMQVGDGISLKTIAVVLRSCAEACGILLLHGQAPLLMRPLIDVFIGVQKAF